MIQNEIFGFLKDSSNEFSGILIVVTGIFLIASFEVVNYILSQIINNWDWLKKIILRDDYIEGTWITAVPFQNTIHYGIFTIKLKDGQYLSSGTRYTPDCIPQQTWRTEASKYEMNSLKLIYKSTFFSNEIKEEHNGLAIYKFQNSSNNYFSSPNLINGSVYSVSNKENESISFVGYKITVSKDLEILNKPDNMKDKFKAIIDSPYLKLNTKIKRKMTMILAKC